MDALSPLIQALRDEGRPRVWSLVITVFGDSVEPRGGRIATARLRALMARIGVEEGALRTALSRLSADGWVCSERTGRSSSYTLTARGRAEAAAATARIYRAPAESPQTWSLGLGGTPPPGALAVQGEVWLVPGEARGTGAEIQLTGTLDSAPQLVLRLVTPEHATALEALRADLSSLETLADPDPLTAAAARTLLIHRWRRLVLRYPELPDALLPAGHPARALRADVARIYRSLGPAAERWLGSDGEGFDALPAGDGSLARRFATTSGPQNP